MKNALFTVHFLCASDAKDKVVGLQDAAVAKAACLSALYELNQACALIRIDGDGDTLLSPDAVTIAGSDIPYLPRNTLHNLLASSAGRASEHQPATLGNTPEL